MSMPKTLRRAYPVLTGHQRSRLWARLSDAERGTLRVQLREQPPHLGQVLRELLEAYAPFDTAATKVNAPKGGRRKLKQRRLSTADVAKDGHQWVSPGRVRQAVEQRRRQSTRATSPAG